MLINEEKEKTKKKLFFSRSILFHFTKFKTNSIDKEIIETIEALNIKNRYKRIYYVVEHICDEIDNLSEGCNQCNFINGKCICHRKLKRNYINGCCRKCLYQTKNGCPSKNVACKLFNCTYVKNRKKIEYENILIWYLLSPIQRFILKSDYYSTLEEVSKDLYYGPILFLIRFYIRRIKFYIKKVKATKTLHNFQSK